MPELSVIVPVYRAEKFLEKCVKSILDQTFSDLELILIEDGSPDRSGALCDALAQTDPRIRVIHQENAGVSAARNRGISMAEGRFVGFVDSDDWVDREMYGTMLEKARDADVVMCDVRTVYEDGRTEEDTVSQLSESCSLEHGDLNAALLPSLAGSACRCIYRRTLLEAHQIRFPQGLKMSEDRVFNIYAMGFAREIIYLKTAFYNRYVNLESCVNSFHPDYREIGRQAARETEKAISLAWDNDETLRRAYLEQYGSVFFGTIEQLRKKDCPLPRWRRLAEIRKICRDADFREILLDNRLDIRERELVIRKRALALYLYEGPLDRKIQNLKELMGSEGLRGVVKKCRAKIRK